METTVRTHHFELGDVEEVHLPDGRFVRLLFDWPPGTKPAPPLWFLGEGFILSAWNKEKADGIGADDPGYWESDWRVRDAMADENSGPRPKREWVLWLRVDGTTIDELYRDDA